MQNRLVMRETVSGLINLFQIVCDFGTPEFFYWEMFFSVTFSITIVRNPARTAASKNIVSTQRSLSHLKQQSVCAFLERASDEEG